MTDVKKLYGVDEAGKKPRPKDMLLKSRIGSEQMTFDQVRATSPELADEFVESVKDAEYPNPRDPRKFTFAVRSDGEHDRVHAWEPDGDGLYYELNELGGWDPDEEDDFGRCPNCGYTGPGTYPEECPDCNDELEDGDEEDE